MSDPGGRLLVATTVSATANYLFLHKYQRCSTGLFALLSTVQLATLISLWSGTSTSSWSIVAAYLTTLGLCIVAYRLSPFHPLAQYPGPVIGKITKLWTVWITWKGHRHLVLKKLHDKYGPVVRAGPNELYIVDVNAIPSILGSGGLPKGQYYTVTQDPAVPLDVLALSGQAHASRRRLWNRGMSTDSLRDYEVTIAKRARQLVNRLEHISSSGPLDLSAWLSFFTFDFMGDMMFGGGFEMIRDGGDIHGNWDLIEKFMVATTILAQLPWLASLARRLPFVVRDTKKFQQFVMDCASKRMKDGFSVKDMWYHLVDEGGHEKETPSVPNAIADGLIGIVAGSDTTASTMSSLFYFLLINPKYYANLQAEVDRVFPQGENALDVSKHGNLPFLSACLNETIRLHPPVPTNGPREVPRGGKHVAGRFIPEGTKVFTPPYCYHRNPEYFSFPDEFLPERWLNESTFAKHNSSAFIPFSFGPANCVGKSLAKQQIMAVVSLLMQSFSIRFADGFDSEQWLDERHDYFVATRGRLLVTLIPRLD